MQADKASRRTRPTQIIALLLALGSTSILRAADNTPPTANDTGPTDTAIRAAVAKSIPLLERAARSSLEQRGKQCFTCHHEGLVVMALAPAEARGFAVDKKLWQEQVDHTAAFLAKNRDRYRQGRGQGGHIDMAGYALWTLDTARWPADETTAAVAEFFLKFQADAEHYQPASHRPPSEHSFFTSSYVALRGLKVYGTPELRTQIAERTAQVGKWIRQTEAIETEDNIFRLRALKLLEADADEVKLATTTLQAAQQPDGGWRQLPDMQSDSYATSTALLALHEEGGLATDNPAYRRGLRFLIDQQQEDGSWHVASRAKAFQVYYESGYPHGKDQFISMTAACWATRALLLALPINSVPAK
ncbi:MAG: hypothetical protein JSS27_18575 [Planctomycetes bacterium]|nr:hypothetical protein [Planctomycetota bacterium]